MRISLRIRHISLGCFFLISSLTLFGQGKFRVKEIGGLPADKSVFVLPPHTQVARHGFWPWTGRTYKPGRRFRYQRVILDGLGNNYSNSLYKLQDAKYEFAKKAIKDRRRHAYAVRYKLKPVGNFASIYYTDDGKRIIFELDYDTLIAQPGNEAFQDASILLLNSLLELQAQNHFIWPPVLTQDIVEKCMELLPLPVEQVLARFGYRENQRHTTILLGPKVFLSVDGAVREGGETDFTYSPTIQYMVGFERDRNTGDRGGRIKPKPYLTLNPPVFTDNYINADSGWVNIASSADIELSTPLNGNDFWALYQPIFKRNVHSAADRPTLGDPPAIANSYIIASDSTSYLYKNPGATRPPRYAFAAWFGQRSFLTPLFPLNLNGQFIFRTVKYRLQDLQAGALVPRDASLYREYKGIYKKVKGKKQQLSGVILLPGDKISF
jgi:hypothetical protein